MGIQDLVMDGLEIPPSNDTPGVGNEGKTRVSKIGLPQNGWFIKENLIRFDDLGGTPVFGNTHIGVLGISIFGNCSP